jgi:hypothetical protein
MRPGSLVLGRLPENLPHEQPVAEKWVRPFMQHSRCLGIHGCQDGYPPVHTV